MPPEEPQSWKRGRERLLKEMHRAVMSTPPGFVNLSVPKHAVTSECLHRITFDPQLRGKVLDVRWSDGSQSSFPCAGLDPTVDALHPGSTRLRLGLMSFRHPELDFIVDLYACRNRELALLKSMAAEEQYSYERARAILLDPVLGNGALIEVYHTGLEPMVVGFYRGVSSVLAERGARGLPRALHIQPMLYAGPPERDSLTPDSPGAKPENYIHGTVWM